MIDAIRSKNSDVLDYIFNHESVFDGICDDTTKDTVFESANLTPGDDIIFYECRKNGETFGALMFLQFRNSVMDAHCACLPHHRGKDFIDSTKMAINDIFKTTNTTSIIAFCTETNKQSMVFSKLCGFQRVGIIPESHIKNNKKMATVLYQMAKGG